MLRPNAAALESPAFALAADTFDAYAAIRLLRRQLNMGILNGPRAYFEILTR